MIDDFAQRGIHIAAVSVNDRQTAEKAVGEWGLSKLPVGYGLSIDDAQKWGLFVSNGLSEAEPKQFVEPGLFLVRPDGTLYSSSIQTMPFARPPGGSLLKSLEWIIDNDYPARGEA